jgi:hypothetical protein
MYTFSYKVVIRDFWKVKLPGVWKIGHIPSNYRSGHEGKCFGKDKGIDSW